MNTDSELIEVKIMMRIHFGSIAKRTEVLDELVKEFSRSTDSTEPLSVTIVTLVRYGRGRGW